MLDNKQLNSFIQTAQLGSFSKAAQKAFISPTALIQQINLLEKRLKVKLFHRSHCGLTLTNAGKTFYRDAKYLLEYWQETVFRAQQAAKQDTVAPIRVGTSIMTPSHFLLDLCPRLQQINPELHIQLVPFENTPENAQGILGRLGENIDIVAGLIDKGFKKVYHCQMLELRQVAVQCAVSLRHPLAHKTILQPQDLFGQKLLLLKRPGFSGIDALRTELLQKYPRIQIEDFPFYDINVFNRCERQECVLMTLETWDNIHPLLKTIPVKWPYTLPFGLMYAQTPSPQVVAFLSAVRTVFLPHTR